MKLLKSLVLSLIRAAEAEEVRRLQTELVELQRKHIELLRQQPGGVANLHAPQIGAVQRWSEEDEQQLIALREKGLLIRQCAAQMNRSYTSVYQRWQVLRSTGRVGASK